MQKIAVLGAGSWGLALALLLNEKGNAITIWCYDSKEKEDILTFRENKRCLPGIKIPLEIQFTTSVEKQKRSSKRKRCSHYGCTI